MFDMYAIQREIVFNDVNFKVLDETSNGFLIVAKTEDINNENYPLPIFAIKDNK